MFHVKHFRPLASYTPNLQAARSQTLVCIIGPEPEPVLGPRREHPVRLGDTEGDQVVDQDAEVAIRPIDDEGLCQHRIQSGDQPLGRRFLIARSAVDLTRHI